MGSPGGDLSIFEFPKDFHSRAMVSTVDTGNKNIAGSIENMFLYPRCSYNRYVVFDTKFWYKIQ